MDESYHCFIRHVRINHGVMAAMQPNVQQDMSDDENRESCSNGTHLLRNPNRPGFHEYRSMVEVELLESEDEDEGKARDERMNECGGLCHDQTDAMGVHHQVSPNPEGQVAAQEYVPVGHVPGNLQRRFDLDGVPIRCRVAEHGTHMESAPAPVHVYYHDVIHEVAFAKYMIDSVTVGYITDNCEIYRVPEEWNPQEVVPPSRVAKGRPLLRQKLLHDYADPDLDTDYKFYVCAGFCKVSFHIVRKKSNNVCNLVMEELRLAGSQCEVDHDDCWTGQRVLKNMDCRYCQVPYQDAGPYYWDYKEREAKANTLNYSEDPTYPDGFNERNVYRFFRRGQPFILLDY